jgi:hypothetical protein
MAIENEPHSLLLNSIISAQENDRSVLPLFFCSFDTLRTGIMLATLRQTNQRSSLCVTPDLFDHLFVCLDWCGSCERQAVAGALLCQTMKLLSPV